MLQVVPVPLCELSGGHGGACLGGLPCPRSAISYVAFRGPGPGHGTKREYKADRHQKIEKETVHKRGDGAREEEVISVPSSLYSPQDVPGTSEDGNEPTATVGTLLADGKQWVVRCLVRAKPVSVQKVTPQCQHVMAGSTRPVVCQDCGVFEKDTMAPSTCK